MENIYLYIGLNFLIFITGCYLALRAIRFINRLSNGFRGFGSTGTRQAAAAAQPPQQEVSVVKYFVGLAIMAVGAIYFFKNEHVKFDSSPLSQMETPAKEKEEVKEFIPPKKKTINPKLVNQKPSATLVSQRFYEEAPQEEIAQVTNYEEVEATEAVVETVETPIEEEGNSSEQIAEGGAMYNGQYIGYSVQVGSFSTFENAAIRINELQQKLGNTILLYQDKSAETSYKVLIGAFDTEKIAGRFKQELNDIDIKGFIKDLTDLEGNQVFVN